MNDFETLKNDPDGIERFVDGLRNHLLNTELKEDGSILRNVVKEELYTVSYTHLTLPTNREV